MKGNGFPTPYITGLGVFLPGEAIPSDEIESYIGSLGPKSSNLREVITLRSGIKTRHFALDKQQQSTYSNTQMAVNAVRNAIEDSPIELEDAELLAAGTSGGDLIGPGLASMVHGELGGHPCEIVSTHGFCSSGVTALKNAYLQIRAGEKRSAVACGSEVSSHILKSSLFEDVENVDLEMDFMRYMLSDGAGAAVVQDHAAPDGLSLRIEWMDIRSFAHENEPCMYMGNRNFKESSKTWLDYPTYAAAAADGAMAVRQDLALLPKMLEIGVNEYARLIDEGMLEHDAIKFIVCDYASESLKEEASKQFAARGFPIPEERWHSNIPTVGNIGAAWLTVAIHDLLATGDVDVGDQILCMVPESGRFTMTNTLLTAAAV